LGLEKQLLRKARILAAKQGTSISQMLAEHIEGLVADDESYERAERQALALLDEGFHRGGLKPASRDDLDER
jgi:hypothetical protein